jgi:hypothetical protein
VSLQVKLSKDRDAAVRSRLAKRYAHSQCLRTLDGSGMRRIALLMWLSHPPVTETQR